MSGKLDQKEYLKKYLSGGKKNETKKKKRRTKVANVGMKIIDADDDIDLSKMRVLESHELDLFGDKEDAPQIAGIIDDRPEELKKLENFNCDKWKVINQDDGYNASITVEHISSKKKAHRMAGNNSPPNSDSDLSPQRGSKLHSPDLSPDRTFSSKDKINDIPHKRKKGNSDSDLSPPRSRRRDVCHRSDKSKYNPKNDNSDSDLSPPRNDRSIGNVSKEKSKMYKKSDQLMYIPNSDSDPSSPSSIIDKVYRLKKVENDNSTAHLSSPKRNRLAGESPFSNKRIHDHSTRDKKKDGQRKKSRWNDEDSDRNIILSDVEKNKTYEGGSKDSYQHTNEKFDRIQGSYDNNCRRNDAHFDSSKRNNERERSPISIKDNKNVKHSERNNSDRYVTDNYKGSLHRNDYNKKNRESNAPKSESNPRYQRIDKTLEGKRAGLQDAKQLKTENDQFKRKENELFGKLSEEFTGKNAQTIKRDMRTGKPRDTEDEKRQQLEKEEKQKLIDSKYSRWGKGLKQIEEREAKVNEYLHEASKPLARYKDDQDLDRALMGQERIGDPMLEYMRKLGQEKMKAVGYEAPPVYKGPYPPNRFDIRPGHRWDGVDRSSGHEKNYFQAKSNRKALDAESYKWSTEDM